MIQVKRSRFPRHPLKLSKCRCTLPLLLLLLLPRGCGCCCYYYYYCCCCWGLLRAKDGMSCVCGACVALKEGRPSYHSYTCDPTSSPPPPSIPSILSLPSLPSHSTTSLLLPHSSLPSPSFPQAFTFWGVCVCVCVCVCCVRVLRCVLCGVACVGWSGRGTKARGKVKASGKEGEGRRRRKGKEGRNWEIGRT